MSATTLLLLIVGLVALVVGAEGLVARGLTTCGQNRHVERRDRPHGGGVRHECPGAGRQRRRQHPRRRGGRIDRHRQRRRLQHRQHPAGARNRRRSRRFAVRCPTHRATRRADHDRHLGSRTRVRARRTARTDRGGDPGRPAHQLHRVDGDRRHPRFRPRHRGRVRRGTRPGEARAVVGAHRPRLPRRRARAVGRRVASPGQLSQ